MQGMDQGILKLLGIGSYQILILTILIILIILIIPIILINYPYYPPSISFNLLVDQFSMMVFLRFVCS